MRVLLIEDEPRLAEAVREQVAAAGHAVDVVGRLDDAEAALRAVDYDLVLLDLHLPDGLGLDLLRTLRRAGDTRPVIILTARDQVSDRIAGLNAGADDYLVKPFDLDELSARVAAVARRYGGNPNPLMRLGPLEIDRAARRLTRDGQEVALTRREWAILEQLLQRPGAVVPKERIEETLYAFGSEIESNSVEVHVSRLRKKLGRDAIRTQRGLGYQLALEPRDAPPGQPAPGTASR
ncbi:two component transcriptional regulator, winged helix family [Tistlia consotensis]|uniref:Two component transcriptional regulator, winged helix family n=1 Tax=Tistlia consotensis USBA 355 TaxID=560819 RepID=A0A1Y6CN61_9PROT|nr:response regulator transcription factor [Tistlia consotensis]SMF64589.1 two component transcriptional regulator, winged helix family [Tistlia consotensis USBA 355]SNR97260.1 two component transcriptional regulator, winged helix family [Tistlia consotensis]